MGIGRGDAAEGEDRGRCGEGAGLPEGFEAGAGVDSVVLDGLAEDGGPEEGGGRSGFRDLRQGVTAYGELAGLSEGLPDLERGGGTGEVDAVGSGFTG